MGDRASGSYSIPEWAVKLIETSKSYLVDSHDPDIWDGIASYDFEDLNYGTNRGLETFLDKYCIPYNNSWGRGSEYDPGDAETRFEINGKRIKREFDGTTGKIDASEVAEILDKHGAEYLKAKVESIMRDQGHLCHLSESQMNLGAMMRASISDENEAAFAVIMEMGVDLDYKGAPDEKIMVKAT